MARYGIWSQ
jgi:hypothetical protein